jgi:hypothetical protein
MLIKGCRVAFVCAATAGATLLVGSTAVAAPTGGPEFTVNCNGDEFTVVTPPGQGAFTPAFVVGTHQVFIPYRVTGTVTVNGNVETFDDVKPAPVPASAVSCTFEATFTEGGQTATVEGTALVVQRGAPA